ncbi:hypothetical protein LZC95_34145 [Pendulispora brunnea]|uniref:Acetolactate decarboxylase n=1 Tax=Pendulispora brunnea TaxID=2905690 RepID=A0ABZ2JYB4_9BACT
MNFSRQNIGLGAAFALLCGCADKSPSMPADVPVRPAEVVEACSLPSATSAAPLRDSGVHSVGDLRRIATNELNGSVLITALEGQGPLWAIGMPHGLDREVLVLGDQVHLGQYAGLAYSRSDGPLPPVAFLVYARVPRWCSVDIPANVVSFQDLEKFVPEAARAAGVDPSRALPFRIEASARSLRWFVVGGTGTGLPDPHVSFMRERRLGPLGEHAIAALGFYVGGEKGVLTNPVSRIHVHFVTSDAQRFVAHLDDDLALAPGGKLLLPDYVDPGT